MNITPEIKLIQFFLINTYWDFGVPQFSLFKFLTVRCAKELLSWMLDPIPTPSLLALSYILTCSLSSDSSCYKFKYRNRQLIQSIDFLTKALHKKFGANGKEQSLSRLQNTVENGSEFSNPHTISIFSIRRGTLKSILSPAIKSSLS